MYVYVYVCVCMSVCMFVCVSPDVRNRLFAEVSVVKREDAWKG